MRIYSRVFERKSYDYPLPKYKKEKQSCEGDPAEQESDDTHCPKWAEQYALHHMIRQPNRSEREFVILREYEENIKAMSKDGKIANGILCKRYRQALSEAEKKVFSQEKFDIIFCTCIEAAGNRVRNNLSPHQCIIDECGMASEPEAMVPISLCKHAILIGDHMQLQPVIVYWKARKCGLSTSLFKRYAKNYKEEEYIFTLKTQYRMVIS